MSAIDDVLMEAAGNGRWSFTSQPTPGQQLSSSSLLYTNVPSWATRSWTVNLTQMRYSGGPLVAAGGPSDNQVNTFTFQARVVWGVDGALETALLDYPWAGCTFCVQAATVRVDILSVTVLNAFAQPLLQGFLSPQPAVQTAIVAPQLTLGPLSINPVASQLYAVPSRACAYRVLLGLTLPGPVPTPANSISLQQEDGAVGAVVSVDGTFPPTAGDSMQNRAGYYPLSRSAQFVRITNTSATLQTAVGVQFLLDMG